MIASPRRITAMGTSGALAMLGDEHEDDRDNGEDGGLYQSS
jgi:hypothetical protein